MKTFFYLLFICLGLVIWNCSKKNPISEQPSDTTTFTPPDDYYVEKYLYLIHGDTIVALVKSCSCKDGVWQNELNLKGYKYVLNNDQLEIEIAQSDSIADSRNITLFYLSYRRISGTSLNGVWEKDSAFIRSSAPLSDSALFEAKLTLNELSAGHDWLKLDSPLLVIYHRTTGTKSFYASFMSLYNKNYAGKVNVRVDSLTPGKVRLIGETTQDTVYISRDSHGQILTSSTNSKYPDYLFDPLKSVCPNPKYPDWLENQFLINNKL